MALDDIVQLTITAQSVTPTRPGFGTALLLANNVPVSWGTRRVKSYSSIADVLADGFTSTHSVYKGASKYFAQSPAPKVLKVGRRANGTVQRLTLQCLSAVAGDIYTVSVSGAANGVLTPLTYTVPSTGSPTTTTVATAISLLVAAVSGVSSTSATDTVSFQPTGAAGSIINVTSWSNNFKFKDVSADPGIVADLAACRAEDGDWYGLALGSSSKAEVVAAAGWAETQKVLFVARSSDSECYDNTITTDVMSTLVSNTYSRSGVLFDANEVISFCDLAWMGNRFAGANPGQDTWAYKSLKGITVDTLQPSQRTAILAKKGNTYTAVAGVNITEDGTTASGQYFDVLRFIDWLQSEIQIRILTALVNLQKIPYTDKGVAVLTGIIKGALDDGIKAGGLASTPAPVVFAPAVADVDVGNRGNRILPNVTFQATLAGAIHVIQIVGTVSV